MSTFSAFRWLFQFVPPLVVIATFREYAEIPPYSSDLLI